MSEWKFNHFLDLSKLLPTASYVIITNGIESILLFPLDRFSLAMDDSVGSHNTVGRRICLDHFELHSPHPTSHDEGVSLVNWSVGFKEVRLQVDLEPVASEALNTVINGENVDSLAILNIWTRLDSHDISKSNTKIVTNSSVHSDLLIRDSVV